MPGRRLGYELIRFRKSSFDDENDKKNARGRTVGGSGGWNKSKLFPERHPKLREILDLLKRRLAADAELHQEGVLAAVFVVTPQHFDGPKGHVPEEQLRRQIGFADCQGDFGSPMARKLADQLADHLPANPQAAIPGMDREVQYVQLGFVELVDHEANNLIVELGHHANAISLAEAAQKILFGPGEVETGTFGLKDFGHVSPDHPANVNAHLVANRSRGGHNSTSPLSRMRPGAAPGDRAASIPFLPSSRREFLIHDVES
jgi:hypothetical protein